MFLLSDEPSEIRRDIPCLSELLTELHEIICSCKDITAAFLRPDLLFLSALQAPDLPSGEILISMPAAAGRERGAAR